MMTVIQTVCFRIYKHLSRQTKESANQISLFAIVMMISFPLLALLGEQHLEEQLLRITAITLCAFLVLHIFWRTPFLGLLPILWYISLLFCLPFFFCYVTLLNNGSTLWLLNSVTAIFILFLVINTLDALLLIILGVVLAFFSYSCSSHTLMYHPGEASCYELLPSFIAAIIIGALFASNRALPNTGKISWMRLLAGGLAYDLRTPLANLCLQSELQAVVVEQLNQGNVQQDIKKNLRKISRNIEMGNQLIRMQLNNIQHEKFDTQQFSIHSMAALLEKSLASYSSSDQHKSLIHVDLLDNFSMWIDESAFINLILSLLNNSLDLMEDTGKGELFIWLEQGQKQDDFNYLHVKDTAKGIYPKNLADMFEPFYSDKKKNTGVGFAWCKLLMKSAGGDIWCQGKASDYAEFIIKFPKIE